MTPFGLLWVTTLPQGNTNGVLVFDRMIRKVLKDVISENRGKSFIDDIAVKPKTKSYFRDRNGRPEEVVPGIRRFVLEVIISLDKVLADIERAGATISGEKSEFLKKSSKVVAYICGEKGKSPEEVKMKKIEDWPPCKNVKDVKAFIELCVYYRIWIRDFSVIVEPLFRLMNKDQDFEWQDDQQEAMDAIKKSLTEAPVLKPIDYESSGQIGLSVDSSPQRWGAILQQEEVDMKKRHPAQYESGLWASSEKKYDSGKVECRGLLKALKNLRYCLYGVIFLREIDARTLVHQLNQPASDLPGCIVNRWLA